MSRQGELAGPHLEAAAEGRLVVQQCLSCQALRWPPLVGCPECLHRETAWVEVAPTGTVWSYVVYHRAFQKDLAADVPYTVVMVELDAGPMVLGRFLPAGTRPTVGDRVHAQFADGAVHWSVP